MDDHVARVSGSAGAVCLMFTAMNPEGGDCDISMLASGLLLAPLISSAGIGGLRERPAVLLGSLSASLRLMIAERRFLSL